MSTHHLLALASVILIVSVRVFFLVRTLWNQPMAHGAEYFLGIHVGPAFYAGAGRAWLRRYHTVVALEHCIEAAAVAMVLAAGNWPLVPVWAGGSALLFMATLLGFQVWARLSLGGHPPVHEGFAVSLEPRRLEIRRGWELVMAGVLALCWIVPYARGSNPEFAMAVIITYVVVAMLPGKIVAVWDGAPLPTERTEEHVRWLAEKRRAASRVMDAVRWALLAMFAGHSIHRAWPSVPVTVLAVAGMAAWIAMAVVIYRSQRRLQEMGRDVRPEGSWATPLRPARLMSTAGWIWGVSYTAGLLALMILLR